MAYSSMNMRVKPSSVRYVHNSLAPYSADFISVGLERAADLD